MVAADFIKRYDVVIFDCDGVILDSNFEKEAMLLRLAENISAQAKNIMLASLANYPGETRYNHFQRLLDNIDEHLISKPTMESLLKSFSEFSGAFMENCDAVQSLPKLKQLTPHSNWCVISSSDELELRSVFAKRGLEDLFELGVFGGPKNKIEIVNDLEISEKAVLVLGDGHKDIELANEFQFDLLFLTNWSAVENCQSLCENLAIPTLSSLNNIFTECIKVG